MSLDEEKQKEMEHLSQETEVYDLESLIVDGDEAKVPISFIYPNTNKTVGAMIRPVNTKEYNHVLKKSERFGLLFLVEMLKIALYKMDGTKFPEESIGKLPAGVCAEIVEKINDISGIKSNEADLDRLNENLMGF
ncbi:MAG: hypothetical protein IJF83_03765 [Methanobrevibacter sp.]|nr:hypothetical protein [Methanobrevibacter sp.]